MSPLEALGIVMAIVGMAFGLFFGYFAGRLHQQAIDRAAIKGATV